MAIFIDRRLNPTKQASINRKKFLDKCKVYIKEIVKRTVASKNLEDFGNLKNHKVILSKKSSISEHYLKEVVDKNFHVVCPGNTKYKKGDYIIKDNRQSIKKNGEEGSEDEDFMFELTAEELLDYFFEDLNLPRLIKKDLMNTETTKILKSGYTNKGIPTNLNVGKSFKNSLARKIALESIYEEELSTCVDVCRRKELLHLKNNIPFMEDIDLKYNNFIKKEIPDKTAVMFCLMDVSGSMDEEKKDMAKRFFILLYLFLKKNYSKVEVVFIIHTEEAKEVSEETFFHLYPNGGTIISSGLKLVDKIIEDRYDFTKVNIYLAQASDGDNITSDNAVCINILTQYLLPKLQYMFFIIIKPRDWSLDYLSGLDAVSKHFTNISNKIVESVGEIYSVFRKFFEDIR